MKNQFLLLALGLLVACSQQDDKCLSLAEQWNSKCPMPLIVDEVELSHVSYAAGGFVVDVVLKDDAPTSIKALQALDERYSKSVERAEVYHTEAKEVGTMPFTKGLITSSAALATLVDSIVVLTNTTESTQGAVPLKFVIKDASPQRGDSIVLAYNEQWESITGREWLNAIVPVEMLAAFGYTGDGDVPELNDEVAFIGTPKISGDGYLNISCSYDAMPYFRKSGLPLTIAEVREKFCNEDLLMEYLIAHKDENPSTYKFLQACKRRGVKLKFTIEGHKDELETDLAAPEMVDEWKRWGGCDTIVIDL